MNQAYFDWIQTCINAIKETKLTGYDIKIHDYSSGIGFTVEWMSDVEK